MGMSFRPPANAAMAIFDLEAVRVAPLEDTFQKMIIHVLSIGTFRGSLDYDPQFVTSCVQGQAQVALQPLTAIKALLDENKASLTAPQMTPGKMVRQSLDPVLTDIFQTCPAWQYDRSQGDVWHARCDLAEGLALLVECRPEPTGPETPPAAHATFEIALIN